MRVAVVGSRSLTVSNLEDYLPPDTTEIISGGAKGVDLSAKAHALRQGLAYTEIRPDYARYGRAAPIRRNDLIVDQADFVLIFWDGRSAGTKYVIRRCGRLSKPHQVHLSADMQNAGKP